MYIKQVREMFPPPSQNIVGICKQINPLIPHYVISRLLTFLKIM
jgi:hypothetical protein